VRRGDLFFFLTAGHCTNLATNWFTSPAHTTLIGTRVGTSFPGNDYGIVRYKNPHVAHPGMVNRYDGTYADMATAATPAVGQVVRRSGATSGLHSGHVTGLDATVNYEEGQVTGLIMTDVCAESGDSGGALYYGTTAYGMTSGGNGDCTAGGITFFQPVTEVLKRYNVNIF
jgi:streptogrisin D